MGADRPSPTAALAILLDGQGYRVEMAESGEEAFEICLEQGFEAVASDIRMGPLSGVQLCCLLHEDPATREMPVVLLTGAGDPRSRYWARQAGAAAYVTKERAREELLPELKRVLGQAPPRAESERRLPGRRGESRERLSQLLEGLLLTSIVATDVRRLIDHVTDRPSFPRELADISAAVADYSYLVLVLGGDDDRETFALQARATLPAELDDAVRQTLGLPELPEPVELLTTVSPPLAPASDLGVRDQVTCSIETGGRALGRIAAFACGRRLDAEDRRGLALVAQEAGLLVQILLLNEALQRPASPTD